MANGSAKKAPYCGSIAIGSQQEINCLSAGINGTIEVFPLPFDVDIGFIHAPSATHGTFVPPKGVIQLSNNGTKRVTQRCHVE
ncbi:conserved hypothetical protein [Xenorhabdus nematophila ATCC 19061]|uniref:Uncharacterized protein n=1 Tax=Xenorhabdus nematophila (strain ATCC 19061 / DSM 3370 / CCUG 14189 / LMG 1036 / NCIMB 9965 / AN6) TaxID=406817 RepID=D3VF12_XENNA|nr:conserved hypothetical protein [Xenorhabdus nematophila ATCC 19061]